VNVEDFNKVIIALLPPISLPVAKAAVGINVICPNLEMIKHNLNLLTRRGQEQVSAVQLVRIILRMSRGVEPAF